MIFEHFMFGSEFTAEFNGRGNQSAARNHKGGHENNSTSWKEYSQTDYAIYRRAKYGKQKFKQLT